MERRSDGRCMKQNRESVNANTRGVLLEGYGRNFKSLLQNDAF
jgi:hypothetical protein